MKSTIQTSRKPSTQTSRATRGKKPKLSREAQVDADLAMRANIPTFRNRFYIVSGDEDAYGFRVGRKFSLSSIKYNGNPLSQMA